LDCRLPLATAWRDDIQNLLNRAEHHR